MAIERRTVLKLAAASAAAGPFVGLTAAPAQARRSPNASRLIPIPDARDGVVRLHLPAGFEYRSFHDTSSPVTLDDGTTVPGDVVGADPSSTSRSSVFPSRMGCSWCPRPSGTRTGSAWVRRWSPSAIPWVSTRR